MYLDQATVGDIVDFDLGVDSTDTDVRRTSDGILGPCAAATRCIALKSYRVVRVRKKRQAAGGGGSICTSPSLMTLITSQGLASPEFWGSLHRTTCKLTAQLGLLGLLGTAG